MLTDAALPASCGYKSHSTQRDPQCATFWSIRLPTRQGNQTSTMAQLVHFLLLVAVGICCCAAAVMEMPIPEKSGRFRRGPEDNWPRIYPRQFSLHGGVYSQHSNGDWMATGEIYNDRPVYRGGRSNWAVYYRVSGYAANKWVLDFNDVSEDWDGTVAIQSTLFASEV